MAMFLLEGKKTLAMVVFAIQTKSGALIILALILNNRSTISIDCILLEPNYYPCIPEVVTTSTLP